MKYRKKESERGLKLTASSFVNGYIAPAAAADRISSRYQPYFFDITGKIYRN